MANGVTLDLNIVDAGQTIFNVLPNDAISLNGQSALNGITLDSTISDKACLFAPNLTWDYLYTDTTAGYYSSNQEVKETPVNNQLSVKIRKKIKIRCSL